MKWNQFDDLFMFYGKQHPPMCRPMVSHAVSLLRPGINLCVFVCVSVFHFLLYCFLYIGAIVSCMCVRRNAMRFQEGDNA